MNINHWESQSWLFVYFSPETKNNCPRWHPKVFKMDIPRSSQNHHTFGPKIDQKPTKNRPTPPNHRTKAPQERQQATNRSNSRWCCATWLKKTWFLGPGRDQKIDQDRSRGQESIPKDGAKSDFCAFAVFFRLFHAFEAKIGPKINEKINVNFRFS